MAIQTTESVGKNVTDRGTLITKSNTEFDKNSFMKILAAQLSNLDPTQDQDSSAYVAQMAQFATMEQMQNLNTTMSDSAYQKMVGKTVIINEVYSDGTNVEGYVTQIQRKSSGTYATMIINGNKAVVDVSKITGVVNTTDTNTIANSRSALNSDFLAASALADKNQNIVVAELDKDGKTVLVKGKVVGAYIDTVTNATVKIKVEVTDGDGNTTTKTYDYGDIVRAGNLTDEEMDVDLGDDDGTDEDDSTDDSAKINTINSATSNDIEEENAILDKIAGE